MLTDNVNKIIDNINASDVLIGIVALSVASKVTNTSVGQVVGFAFASGLLTVLGRAVIKEFKPKT